MARRLGIAALLILGIIFSGTQIARPSAAQSSPPPASHSAKTTDLPGAATLVTATGQANLSSIANPRLRLEQIDLPGGSTLADHTAAGPELLVVISGAAIVADSFGFSNTYAAGANATIATDTVYGLSNSGAVTTRVYRVSFAGAAPSNAATPIAGTSASPVANAVQSTVLIDAKIPSLSSKQSTIFLTELSWKAGAASGQLDHTGPIGVYVETGSLTIASPSGITGDVKAGKGVTLPATAPLIASNSARSASTAIVFGVSSSPDATTLSPFVPTPTPTATFTPAATATFTVTPTPTITPTPTTVPTNTATAMSTPSPTPTIVPTETPIPTNTPKPTATSTPIKAGSTLYKATKSKDYQKLTMSGGWQIFQGMIVNNGSGGIITLPYTPPVSDYKFEVDVQPVKGSDRVTLQARDGAVSAEFSYDHDTELFDVYLLVGQEAVGGEVYLRIQGGDWHTLGLEVEGNTITAYVDGKIVASNTDNRLIRSGPGGQVTLTAGNNEQVNVKNFKITAPGSDQSADSGANSTDAPTSAIVPVSGSGG